MKNKKKPVFFESRWWYGLCLLFALTFCAGVSAQKTVVKGNVFDKENQPVIGANILEKGTTNGTISDVDGNFSITVSSLKAVLLIKYIGYKEVEVPVSPNMRIMMEEDSKMLEDVVVIGYGSVKKSDVTGSVTAIKPDEFNKGLRTTAQDALVGKISGVNVVTNSGAPGSGATIRIRSGASLSASNDPLIVIDGVPVDNSTIEGGSNVIGGINPNDIETFTVLKDASATAIYGSRASNGVIVITTKKGDEAKPHFNYSTNLSISNVTKTLNVLSADEFRKFVPTVSGVPNNVTMGTTSTDWQDEIYRTAFGQEHNLSVSGRIKQKTPYRLSMGYTNQNGVIRTNSYERFTFNGGASPKFLDEHLSVDLNLKLSYEDNHKVDESVVNNTLRYDPTRPVKTNSTTAATVPGLGYFIWMNGNSPMAIQTDNPVAQLELQSLNNKVTRSIGNAAFNYKVHRFEDLQLNLNLGYDVLQSKYSKRVPELAGMMYTSNMKDGTGLVYDSKQNKYNYLLDLYANYSHTFNKKHSFSAMGGYGWQHFRKKFDATTLSPSGKELFSPNHYESEYYLLSFYGRLNYAYDNRYMITATLRSDASSRFAKNNRWGLFPSVALGWKISQEAFLRDSEILSDLKLRLSYGQTGQQDILNDYPYMTTFTVSYPESCYQFGEKWYHTYRPNGYDSDIKWETTETYNIGLDYGFLNNRIYGSVDYYQRHTRDLLNTISVISGTNYSSVLTTNIGEMDNKGIEFSINAVPVHTKNWKWTMGMNYTWNDSEITKLNVIDSDANFVQTGAISGTGKTVQVFMVGQRPYTFYLAKQGYDIDGNPIEGQYIQPDGSLSAKETKYATNKSALPKSYLGLHTVLSYKDWDFAISGHGAFGNYIYNYVAADQYIQSVYSDQGNFSNILHSTKERGFQSQQLYSDYFLEKGNFFRIDNISLGYTIRKLWNKSSSLRLTLGVQNVVAFTGYSGIDPEIYSGIDKEVYPRPRIFSVSANLNF
ncbi:TonB-dependent receptor [Bacteroides heparinolyticus]|uniref:TonB-dependent receptor n=1 Tax=Prevotella heparinolytica TaxID=28113 RepID=A0A3P2A211_9BACE|nr:TonB-dependent receptor [Bacteroides heparinolyticus]RRD89369.1 TonB-dependent receptor [Bacteroides heparinolyticus]